MEEKPDMGAYGRAIRQRRDTAGLNQKGVAAEVGVSRTWLAALERGSKVVASKAQHLKIAKALKLLDEDAEYLWGLAAPARLYQLDKSLYRFHVDTLRAEQVQASRLTLENWDLREKGKDPDAVDFLARWIREVERTEGVHVAHALNALISATTDRQRVQEAPAGAGVPPSWKRLTAWLAKFVSLDWYLRDRVFTVFEAVVDAMAEKHGFESITISTPTEEDVHRMREWEKPGGGRERRDQALRDAKKED